MKGISPFIATVLLIAFTIGIGAMMGPWISRLAQENSENVAERTKTDIDCQDGSVKIVDTSILCEFTAPYDKLNFTIQNTGGIDLYNFTCEISLGGNIYSYTINNSLTTSYFSSNNPLKPGQSKIAIVDITDNLTSANPSQIRIWSYVCPAKDDKITDITCT